MWVEQPRHPAEWEDLIVELRSAGVAGAEDFGHFVNDTRYLAPARFDEVAACPILLEALPGIEDHALVATVGRYLRNPSVGHDAYPIVLGAFQRWGLQNCDAGWVLGDTLASKARPPDAPQLIELSIDPRYGTNRQMIVDALWRFRKTGAVEAPLRMLLRDGDVSLHAMSALQRTIGRDEIIPVLTELIAAEADERITAQARRQLRRIEKKRRG